MSEIEIARKMFVFGTADPAAAESVTAEAMLVDRIRSGEREAFDEIYRMFAPMVHGIVLARVPHDEAQDVVQDVFLTAYNKLDTLREKSAVGAWLVTIARNRSAEFYRHAKPTEELSEEITGRHTPHNEANEVLAGIRSLPEADRETLILRLVEGMTGIEIAARTGLKPESVRVNLHRGMELLRQRLGIGVEK
jgi:RNA polymerase sigma-70 factor (ECF subfamily)